MQQNPSALPFLRHSEFSFVKHMVMDRGIADPAQFAFKAEGHFNASLRPEGIKLPVICLRPVFIIKCELPASV